MPAMKAVGASFSDLGDEASLRDYGRVARNCGVTTVADLLSGLHEDEVAMLERVTGEAACPARYVPIMNAMVGAPEDEAARAVALRARSTAKLHLGRAKLFTDGAIQGGTAKLRAPGYMHLQSLDHITTGHQLADVAAIIGTIDIVFGEIDR